MREVPGIHRWYMNQLIPMAERSKDPRRQVAAKIVRFDSKGRSFPVADGINGFPYGIKDTPELWAKVERNESHPLHAEINCVIMAGRNGGCDDCTMYVRHIPCPGICAPVIIQSGITRVIYDAGYTQAHIDESPRWYNLAIDSLDLFREAGVQVWQVRDGENALGNPHPYNPAHRDGVADY